MKTEASDYFADIYYMLAEEGIYKVIGAIVLAVFFFILVCRLLGFQARVVESFSIGLGEKRKGSKKKGGDSTSSLFGGNAGEGDDDSASHEESAKHHERKAKEHHHNSKAGHAELRKDQEKQIESLDERLRAELLHHVLDKTKDKSGNWINPLLTEDDLIGNPQSMELIQNLNELWKFRETLEAAINTLDNTDATSISMPGSKSGGFGF